MKNLYSIVCSLIAVLGFACTATAQVADVPTPERQAERMTEVMSKRLDLSKQQTQQVLDLNLVLAQKETDLLQNEQLDFFERVEKLKSITDARQEKLQQVLDRQQYEKYHALNHRTRNESTLKQ